MEFLRIATAGSVDDGKSTLIGRLLFETGSLLEDQLAAVESASQKRGEEMNLALVTDGLRAEREQNITIDVAYRPFQTDHRRILLADCPGHVQYTRNMATAVSTADLVIALIDAEKGVTEQTKRHLTIAALMRVPKVVIVANKMDLLGFDEARFDAISKEIEAFAKGLPHIELQFIPVSALRGDNVTEGSKSMPWYTGPTVLEVLNTATAAKKSLSKAGRLPVQCVLLASQNKRAFAGTVAGGGFKVGESVTVLPSGRNSLIRQINALHRQVADCVSGEAVSVELEDELDISRGNLIVATDDIPQTSRAFAAVLCWLNSEPLRAEAAYRLMQGPFITQARVTRVRSRLDDPNAGSETEPTLAMNDLAEVEIETGESVPVDLFEEDRSLGSFVLVDGRGNTVACGMISQLQVDQVGHSNKVHPVLWMTGLSGSGKSTIAHKFIESQARANSVVHLDGDSLRTGLCSDLGFAPEDRVENVRRMAEVAKLFSERGQAVICSLISPLKEHRELARQILGERMVEVYVACPVDECRQRDPKGLYRRADAGLIQEFTGVSAPYDVPEKPDVALDTSNMTPDQSAVMLASAFANKLHELN